MIYVRVAILNKMLILLFFPHRAHYYDKEAIDSDGQSWENRGELVIGKHREGEINSIVRFSHDKVFKKIMDDDNYIKKVFTESVNVGLNITPNLDFYGKENEVPF